MVIRAAVQHLGVQIRAGVIRKTGEEIFEQFGLQIADVNHIDLLIVDQRRTAAEIHRDNRQRFIHRLDEITGAIDAAAVAERLGEEIAEDDAGIFDRVVLIHIEIALRVQFEIESAVLAEKLEHVIQKANAGRDLICAGAFDDASEPAICVSFVLRSTAASLMSFVCERSSPVLPVR